MPNDQQFNLKQFRFLPILCIIKEAGATNLTHFSACLLFIDSHLGLMHLL